MKTSLCSATTYADNVALPAFARSTPLYCSHRSISPAGRAHSSKRAAAAGLLLCSRDNCLPVLFYGLEACSLRKYQYKSNNYVTNSTFRKIFNTRSQETVDVCLEMFGCFQAERTIAMRKQTFLNKFSVIHNALCRVFVAIAKTELESCFTDVQLSD